ncbi:hypothetical protein EZ449_03770 [Pedobacter frigidisoli]|uniref:Uncharacterized protein n=1 Tax=Pedobacter frigidisoli TaxID=2530455 RepID=A0A4R0P891_9SPHI|nr:hypothetical protein [Pedobacter frigidisoli]TCD12144.1 hypothetical protein EZ449_03770 [Pedobacter frigidisoli]
MKVKGTFIHTLKTGEKALILLTDNEEEQEKLFHYLSIDAYQFKKEIVEKEPRIELISAGYTDNEGKVVWNENYIPIPKWFEMN